MPGHANEKRAVMAKICGPPVLRIRHKGMKILLEAVIVEAFEFLRVVEALVHGVGGRIVLVKNVYLQLVGPPVLVGRSAAGGMIDGAFVRRGDGCFLTLMIEGATPGRTGIGISTHGVIGMYLTKWA